jgi:hypothetical protein
MVMNSVECDAVILSKKEDKILFTTNMYDLGRKRLLYQYAGSYDPKTEECDCHFIPQIEGLDEHKNHFSKGKNRTCKDYPTGGCEVICKEVLQAADSFKKKQ